MSKPPTIKCCFRIRPANCKTRFKTITGSSKRQARDPADYASYDAVRDELHANKSSSSGFISSALNFLSQTAFGDHKRKDEEGGSGLYRSVLDSKWATELRSNLSTRPGYNHSEGNGHSTVQADEASDDDLYSSQSGASVHHPSSQGLEVLLNCDPNSVAAIARRWPPLLDLELGCIQQNLLTLKDELPRVDVTEMVRQHPRAFLAMDSLTLRALVSANVRVLQEGLEGANIDAMAQEDPLLLLQDPSLLEEGIQQTRQLWDVDAAALAASDPWKLALAVRAMTKSSNALPYRF